MFYMRRLERWDSAFGCKSLHSKKSIFVEGLNFYLEQNTVRAVWSHNMVCLIFWASFVMCDHYLERKWDNEALQHNSYHLWEFLSGNLVLFTKLCGLCQCAFAQWDYCVLGAVCDVMDMLGVILFCKSLRCTCSHYWLIVVSLPSGLFVLYKCAVFYCIVFILIKLWLYNYVVLTWTLQKLFGVSGWFFQKSLTLCVFFPFRFKNTEKQVYVKGILHSKMKVHSLSTHPHAGGKLG